MQIVVNIRAITTAVVLAMTPVAFAQSSPTPSSPSQNSAPPCAANVKPTPQAPCSAPASNPQSGSKPSSPASADDPFPFPGESTAPAKTPPSAPNKGDGTDDPFPFPGEPAAAPSKTAPSDKSSDQFPFPGEPAGSSSSSSSSSGDNTAPDPDDSPVLSTRKRPAPKAKPQTPDEREMEDLTVARFYRDKGNFNAVYLRSKDAIQIIPDDPEAHLMLAEAAQKLDKRDEAIAEYRAALQLDPTKEQKKIAVRGLEDLKAETARK